MSSTPVGMRLPHLGRRDQTTCTSSFEMTVRAFIALGPRQWRQGTPASLTAFAYIHRQGRDQNNSSGSNQVAETRCRVMNSVKAMSTLRRIADIAKSQRSVRSYPKSPRQCDEIFGCSSVVISHTTCRAPQASNRSPEHLLNPDRCPEARPLTRRIQDPTSSPVPPFSD